MNWLALLLSLTLLVATHELGHLAFAKLFHTRVRRYYDFFNWNFSILKDNLKYSIVFFYYIIGNLNSDFSVALISCHLKNLLNAYHSSHSA